MDTITLTFFCCLKSVQICCWRLCCCKLQILHSFSISVWISYRSKSSRARGSLVVRHIAKFQCRWGGNPDLVLVVLWYSTKSYHANLLLYIHVINYTLRKLFCSFDKRSLTILSFVIVGSNNQCECCKFSPHSSYY